MQDGRQRNLWRRKQQTGVRQVQFVQSVLNLRPQPLRIHKLTASLKYKLSLILDFEEQQTKSSVVVHYILNLRPRDTPAHFATEINNILILQLKSLSVPTVYKLF